MMRVKSSHGDFSSIEKKLYILKLLKYMQVIFLFFCPYKVLKIKLTPLKIKFKQVLLIMMEEDLGREGKCAIQNPFCLCCFRKAVHRCGIFQKFSIKFKSKLGICPLSFLPGDFFLKGKLTNKLLTCVYFLVLPQGSYSFL